MKAIILAAGEGRRLRPLTANRPKCLVHYQGRTLLDWILGTIRANQINDIVVIKGYCPETVAPAGVRSYENKLYASTNMVYTLFCAEAELTGDLVISYSDIVYSKKVLKTLLQCPADFALTVDLDWQKLWSARMEDPLKDAETLKLNSAGEILEVGKTPQSLDEIQGQYMGLIKISGRAIPEVRKFYHSLDTHALYDGKDFNNMYMTSFIQLVINQLMPVQAVPVHGGWLEIDAIKDLEVPVDLTGY